MTADEALASHRSLVGENGQPVAIGRYTVIGAGRGIDFANSSITS